MYILYVAYLALAPFLHIHVCFDKYMSWDMKRSWNNVCKGYRNILGYTL